MRRVLSVVLGAFLMAAALVIFLSPASLVTGGASGAAVIVKALSLRFLPFAIPLWFTNLAVNIPLIVLARARFGRSFVIKTLIGTLLLSFFLNIVQNIMQYFPLLLQEDDDFINAVFGGAVMGLGMGLVLSGGATTGGSDLLAAILREKIRGVGIAALIFIIDLAVITFGSFVFGIQKAMYSIVAVYVSTKAANLILEGLNFARVAFIMTDKPYKTAECLMRRLHRGATLLNGEGAYTGSAKNVVMIVISKRQAAEVKEIVSSVDPHAFMFVADVREVMGEFS